MGNLKQRFIKAGRDFNYAEGVKVKASSAVFADQIVYVDGSSGPFLTVVPADADGGVASGGRLMIAKHDIPVGGYGIVLPWKLVTTLATNTPGTPVAGDPVYLHDVAGAAVASNLTLTCPSGDAKAVVVGRITVANTVALGAAILVNAAAPEERVQGGQDYVTGATALSGRPLEFMSFLTAAGGTTFISMEYPVRIVKVECYKVGGTGGNLNIYNGAAGTTAVCATITMGTTPGATVTSFGLNTADATVAAEAQIRAVTSGAGGDPTDRVGIYFIRD